jgi:hypothetical protein
VLAENTREAIIRHFEDLDFWTAYWERGAVVVTGSSARGVVDEFADVDVHVYVAEACLGPLYAEYRKAAEEDRIAVMNPAAFRYGEFPFVLVAGVRGHYRVYGFEEAEAQLARYDDVAMWVHQHGLVLHDPAGRYAAMQGAASAYPEEVWREKLRYHLLEAIEMAGAAGNPLRRNDLPAVTLTMTGCLAHALRLCCLLDRKPFPYDKWLYREALETRAGRELGPLLAEFFEELRRPALTRQRPVNYLRPGHRNADLEEFRLYVIWLQIRSHLEAQLSK